MHWNHSEGCRLIALSMAQDTEVVQVNESNNFAFTKTTSTSSNKLIGSMLDNMKLNVNMCDNNLCGYFSDLNDGNNTKSMLQVYQILRKIQNKIWK
jgi:hypothetical protein